MVTEPQAVVHVHEVMIIGAGPSGLALAARLSEHMPAANFTDDEHQRFHWINRHRNQPSVKHSKTGAETRRESPAVSSPHAKIDLLVLDATDKHWMARWDGLFKMFDISHLRSPMFFHVDPAERDGLLSYAHMNDREKELNELRGCVGKELSKHQRKKRERSGNQPRTEPTIDERDRNDYFVPSTPLFSSHCNCIIDRYNIRDDIVSHENVEDIRYGILKEYSDTEKVFTVKTDSKIHHAKIVVLAVGGNPAQIPCKLSAEEMEGATHAMHLKEMPSPHIRRKLADKIRTNILVVGGGLTSAQLADLAIRRGVSKVWLIMRSNLKIKHFDIGLEWVGKFRNHQHSRFWLEEKEEERWKMYDTARKGGSITPAYNKVLERHVVSGRLSMLQKTTIKSKQWDPTSKTWSVSLCGDEQELPPIDHIYFATGVHNDFECLPFLQSMISDFPIKACGGFPCITQNMAWREDVPLFVAGRFAALQLGPGAPNLIGARIGAERIAWSIQDKLGSEEGGNSTGSHRDKFNYATGRCNSFDALADLDE
ncbi:Uu.00g020950.m01.CDS01 [Anthostomella pinea]|uniref:L-ornithine N(5)-monooxygenase [NAD(P)H] n=1 Tax=Anthostomella pinea TaxID=933095 RepID=A0AAI8VTR4_9PEZI|nr:Uu.00g020950.m01.CDS01 [Anthostomella pinea]